MALGTFTTVGVIGQDRDLTGTAASGAGAALRSVAVEFTIGATGDYSSGLALTAANLANYGITGIVTILGVVVRQSGGTIRPLLGLWDSNTSKLRLYLDLDPANTGGANIPFTEITPAAHLAANDVVRCVIVGF